MTDMYAVTSDGGYVLIGRPKFEVGGHGFIVRAEATMQAKMRLVGLELRWDNGIVSSTWLDHPVGVHPGVVFHGRLDISIPEQAIGPLVAGAGLEPATSRV